MNFIKTGMKVSKTFRNVGRLREIVLIFARHGFEEFVSLGITKPIPGLGLLKSKKPIRVELEEEKEKDYSQIIGFRLRKCFEELGPAFIKFGQLLSSREDLFDLSFINEMKILRDKVEPVPFALIKPVIEKSLGCSIGEVFQELDESALGTASIGVVFQGTLLTGEDVVIKVKRPNIERMIETDFSILLGLVTQIEKSSSEIRYLGISRVIRDFSSTIKNELNFNLEALNSERFKKNVEKHDKKKILYIPKIYKDYSSKQVLVMERLRGIAFSDTAEINKVQADVIKKMEDGMGIFISSFLKDGFYHADLHGGNFFYLENGKIGLIDFGLMGSLGKKSRINFIAILYALLTYNYENLIYEFLDVADYDKIPDVDALVADVKETLSSFIGLTAKQTNFSEVFPLVVRTINSHQIYLPRDWYMLFRALITLDGVGKSLNMDFDVFSMLEEEIQEILKNSINKEEIVEEIAWAGKDILSSVRMFPRHLKWFIKDIAKHNYTFRIQNSGYEKELKLIAGSLVFCGFVILASLFLISGVVFIATLEVTHFREIPTISWIFWGAGALAFLKGAHYLKKKS